MYNTDPGFYIEDKWNKDPGFMVESNWDKDPGFFMPKKEGKDFLREYLSGGEEYSQAGTDIPSFGVSRSYEGGGGTEMAPYFNEKISGNMTPADRQILNDHVKSLKQSNDNPNAVRREIERMNQMYGKYGMSWQALGEKQSPEVATTPAFGGDPRQQIPADWAEKMMKPGSPMPTGLREQIFGKPTQETPEGTLPQARGTFFPTPFSVASVPVGQDENLPMSQWAFRDAVETLRDKKRGALTKPIELSPALQDRMRTMRSSFGI